MTERYYDFAKYTVRSANEEFPRHSEASVLELKDGTLLMAWQCHSRSSYGSGDESPSTILLMNSDDNGASWRRERIVVKMKEGCVNVYCPSLFRETDGTISLYFVRFLERSGGDTDLSNGYRISSADEGETWGDEALIWENSDFSTLNHAVRRLSDGAVLYPRVGGNGCWQADKVNYEVYVMRSEDGFKTYTESNKITVPMRGLMEPCIAERSDGTLNMVMRTQLGSIFVSESIDGGRSWSKPQASPFRSPESCPCVVSIPNSDAQLVIWNNSEYDIAARSHFGKRTPLTMAISRDGLKTFSDCFDIETDPERAFTNPAVTVTSSGLFVLTYWTSPWYNPDKPQLIDLKMATFKISI